MHVGFFLEANVEVGLDAVTIFNQQAEPFKSVPNIKANVKQLSLLGRVNAFMVYFFGIEFLHGEDDAEDIYGIEAAFDGEPSYMHYLCHLQLFIFIYCTDRKLRIV